MERSRTYECMLLLDNREVRKGWQPLKDSVAAVFNKHGAEVLSSRRWDERRLGYPVRGQLRGTYLLVYFKTGTSALTAIRRDLQFAEPVMRFLTTQCDEIPETAYEPEAEFDVNAIPEEEVAPAVVGEEPAAKAEPAKEEPAEGEDAEEAGSEGGDAEEKAEEGSSEGGSESEPAAETTESETKTEA